jgi:hypothetical protein
LRVRRLGCCGFLDAAAATLTLLRRCCCCCGVLPARGTHALPDCVPLTLLNAPLASWHTALCGAACRHCMFRLPRRARGHACAAQSRECACTCPRALVPA